MSKQLTHDDWRLTAYALGELEGAERAAVEAFLAGDESARLAVREIQVTAKVLTTELAEGGAETQLTAKQREAIELRLNGAASRQRGRLLSMRSAFALAASGLVISALAARFWQAPLAGRDDSQQASAYADNKGLPPASFRYELERSEIGAVKGGKAGEIHKFSRLQDGALQALGYGGAVDVSRSGALVTDARGGLPRLRELADTGYYAGSDEEDGRSTDLDFEPSNTESYDYLAENPFQLATDIPLSTFSIDVDTASYSNVRRFLNAGNLPPADAVRLEELINYFPYDYPTPTGTTPFSVDIEVTACPWQPEHRLVRIGLKGRPIELAERKSSNLVFLLDVSGSMNSPDKLPLLVRSMSLLVQNLDERDSVAMVVYAGASGLVLEATNAGYQEAILQALERLSAGGSTNGGAGIELAYKVAGESFIKGGINRVILATDGDFNVGISDQGSLQRLIEQQAKSGVFLTVLGFGTGNLQDSKMETLADKGNGNYAYIDNLAEARKVLVEQMGGTLDTIAKDVKIQVEFNPAEVAGYRLIGYENRLMAAQDFRDDTKDAGEIGAGHTVTALYEVVPAGMRLKIPGVDPLRYQTPAQPSASASNGELLTVSLRYKRPDEDVAAEELTIHVMDEGKNFFEASSDTRFAAAVAGYGMLLRKSSYSGKATFGDVRSWALEASDQDPGGYRAAFLELVRLAEELGQR